jgi:hypothetical protein
MRRQVWLVLAGAMILLAGAVVGFGLRAAHDGGHDVVTAAADGDSGDSGDEAGDPDAGPQLAKARVEAARQSPLQAAPVQAAPTAGWAGAALFNATGNDWEPAVAAAPNNGYVYVLTTRYGGTPACKSACPNPALILKVSSDYGKTWGAESYLCACKNVKAQNDPEMVVLPGGTVYSAWMNDWKIVFSKSTDHGKTWSAPVTVVGNLSWSDKPIIAASANGNDVYIAFNKSDAYVAVSHNAGSTWKQVVSQANGRYHFANSGTVLPNGTIAFGEVSYAQDSTGPDVIQVHRSTDNGATWSVVDVDTVQEMSHCVTGGCSIDYWGPNAALAADASGNLVLGYNGNTTALAPQRMWARTSTNGGATWTARVDVTGLTGSGSGTAGAAYPAASGTGTGDFRMYFMDDRFGTAAWNVWFVQSTNGGSTWSAPVRISDATSGPSYVTASGFAQPYGDYGQIAARADGGTIAVWGAGVSYTGPGGTWINRTTP